jgi:rhodanese-related sulfurtransferase
MIVKQLSATELKNKIQQNDKLLLLDVREPHEYQYARIADSVLIPLNQIPQRLGELDVDQETVVICHHGMRSQQAASYLVQSGFKNIANLTGGIDAWSCVCDSSVARY